LYENKLKNLHEKTFSGLEKLKILKINDNKLEFLHPNLFKDLISLEVLYISYNPLKTINENILQNLINLIRISLGATPLSTFPATLFEKNRNLEFISIGAGRITRVSNKMFSHLRKLTILHFEDNFCASQRFNRHNSSILFTEDMLLPCSCSRKDVKKMADSKKRNLLICLGVVALLVLLMTAVLLKANQIFQTRADSGRFFAIKKGE
jgi:Leucine-rich repeat (LRR) protein